jgi:two-component system, sensor histidine kinase and response regulator
MADEPQKILLVDDDALHRTTVANALRLHGYLVEEADEGAKALETITAYRPDLIISDVLMPGMDGYDFVAALRKDPSFAVVPVILMTGDAGLPGMRQSMESGADDYLAKPFTIEELLQAVRMRLERQASLRRESEEKLRALRESIALMLPHELRTPLVGILGIADLLETHAEPAPPETLAEYSVMLRTSGQRLLKLTERFLFYAQLELLATDPSARLHLGAAPLLDQSPLILRQAQKAAEEARRPDDLHVALGEVPLRMESQLAERLFEELLSNAFKFSPPRSKVMVSSSRTEMGIQVSIRNEGRGFRPEETSAIGAFLQFSRKLHEQQGTGLGLFIAKRIVELHGGGLQIESSPGINTTVNVRFPWTLLHPLPLFQTES